MAVGLQTFDQSGNILIDLTSRLLKYLGYIDVTDYTSGSIQVVIPAGTRIFYMIVPLENTSPYRYPADVQYSGSTLSWQYLNLGSPFIKVKCRIVYGYF